MLGVLSREDEQIVIIEYAMEYLNDKRNRAERKLRELGAVFDPEDTVGCWALHKDDATKAIDAVAMEYPFEKVDFEFVVKMFRHLKQEWNNADEEYNYLFGMRCDEVGKKIERDERKENTL